jgi:hypothetical protein
MRLSTLLVAAGRCVCVCVLELREVRVVWVLLLVVLGLVFAATSLLARAYLLAELISHSVIVFLL